MKCLKILYYSISIFRMLELPDNLFDGSVIWGSPILAICFYLTLLFLKNALNSSQSYKLAVAGACTWGAAWTTSGECCGRVIIENNENDENQYSENNVQIL